MVKPLSKPMAGKFVNKSFYDLQKSGATRTVEGI